MAYITNKYSHCGNVWFYDYCDSFEPDKCPDCGTVIMPVCSVYSGTILSEHSIYPENNPKGVIATGDDGYYYAFSMCGDVVERFFNDSEARSFLDQRTT